MKKFNGRPDYYWLLIDLFLPFFPSLSTHSVLDSALGIVDTVVIMAETVCCFMELTVELGSVVDGIIWKNKH